MSDGVNKVFLLGNLGTDPELRETSTGKSVCNFRMATNSTHGKAEYRRDKTEWHHVVVWGILAEMCVEYLKKGSKVHLEGHLQTRDWEDSRGHDRRTTEIVADKIVFVDRKEDDEC
ncbi:MAG: single-stranded DNA-binding protein [Planctomycetota bacterium]|jgi:single-strand DNA-binding protein